MIKQKSHWWWFTLFAHPYTSTTIYPHIYLTRDYHLKEKKVQVFLIKHENVHLEQQKENGLIKFLFLYIFAFPILWNPYRYKWELEAYQKAGMGKENAKKHIKTWNYGFLLHK